MRTIFISIALLLTLTAAAQQNFNDSIARSRYLLKKNDMVFLGSFAVANIATGFIAANNTNGEAKYFWQMNAYWNFFNLGIAGLGYFSNQRMLGRTYSLQQNYHEQKSIERLYIVNFGLDVVYITGGFLLRNKGDGEANINTANQYKGFGTSIAAQGGFLLLMDGLMIMLHHNNTIKVRNKLSHLQVTVAPLGIGVRYAL